ncbi:MAG TPA: glycerophosphodiester phosphodiesterase family protein [Trueperaceae bacterium]|nr:glycerophosphodiester phosphodiesterase family protein [Trueperaceae bacterium]
MSNPHKAIRIAAHRGWSAAFPENSLAAFAAAYSAGVDELEFDVRHTMDGVPVIVHDARMARTSDSEAEVACLSIDEFLAASLREPGGSVTPGHTPPTLLQVLDLFGGRIGMNIHVSDNDPPASTFSMLAQLPWANDNPDVYIAGRENVLERALQHAPRVHRACLVNQNKPEEMLYAAKAFRCQRVQFFKESVTEALVASAKSQGIASNLFFSDELEEALRLYDLGLETLLTNDAGPLVRARDAYRARKFGGSRREPITPRLPPKSSSPA